MVFGIVGCSEGFSVEELTGQASAKYENKYCKNCSKTFLNFENSFFAENEGIGILCSNGGVMVDFFLIQDKEDWIDTGEEQFGTYEADYEYHSYRYFSKPTYYRKSLDTLETYTVNAYEVFRDEDDWGTFSINSNEMKTYRSLLGGHIRLNRKTLDLEYWNATAYTPHWAVSKSCSIKDNVEIIAALDSLLNRAIEAKRTYSEKVELDQQENNKKNKL